MKKLVSVFLLLAMMLTAIVAPAVADVQKPNVKLGVAVYNLTDAEVMAFRAYYEDYLAPEFGVTLIYSEAIEDHEQEISFIENCAAQGAKGIISFVSYGNVDTAKKCKDYGMYYIIAATAISDEEFAALAPNEYFLGTMGPNAIEGEQAAAQAMAEFFKGQGYTRFFVAAGDDLAFDMFANRRLGCAKVVGGDNVTGYPELAEGVEFANYYRGFSIDASVKSQALSDAEVILATFGGVENWAAPIEMAGMTGKVHLGTIASFGDMYYTAFNAEPAQIEFLAGKYSSVIGPAFAAIYNAATGYVELARGPQNEAFRINQGYWFATSKDEFNEMYNLANNVGGVYAYAAEDLKQVCGVFNSEATYEDFMALANAWDYESCKARAED